MKVTSNFMVDPLVNHDGETQNSNSFDVKNDLKVLGTSRCFAPTDFIFKIQSFSSLLGLKTKKVKSGVFESGGHKWRLCLSLSGSKKEDGGDHISLYLSIADTHKLPSGWEVLVNFKLFLFNQTENEYLSIEDVEGKVWRFHCLKTEWGYDQLLPLSSFRDPTNGFVFDDSCSFGAEIYVIKPDNATFECLDLSKAMERSSKNIFTWKIQDFSNVTTTRLYSPEFVIKGRKWRLELCRDENIIRRIVGQPISILLTLIDSESLGILELKAEYNLRIRDQVSGGSKERKMTSRFSSTHQSVELSGFLSLKELEYAKNGYLLDNTLVLEVEIIGLSEEVFSISKRTIFYGCLFLFFVCDLLLKTPKAAKAKA